MTKTPSLNDKLSKTFSSLKGTITSLNLHRNELLANKIKTEYFSDVRYGKMIKMMDECVVEMEKVVCDMKGMREKFALERGVLRSGNVQSKSADRSKTGDRRECTALVDKKGKINSATTRRKKRIVMRRKGGKLREQDPNIK
ncbi:hypothetical protein THOM_2993 [Trachipleistophora hominis]|uniref:Uncharacterized protein n=1 Tax=Trachipleistophora hominis TaxID=72359 RepID=L7JTL1_TRAHO|nr:hypothetical protein THOM_2993 [Trachipleistophora hominis]